MVQYPTYRLKVIVSLQTAISRWLHNNNALVAEIVGGALSCNFSKYSFLNHPSRTDLISAESCFLETDQN